MGNRWLDDLTVSQETSLSLLARAQAGDAVAMEALMGRYLPRLQRWAHGRLPTRVRSLLDTDDVVQETMIGTLRNIGTFQPRHDGALLAYLRQAVANRIRNELRRRVTLADGPTDLDTLPSGLPSPLDSAISRRSLDQYERALSQLDETERAAIIARFEMGYSYDALARALERPSSDAARKVTERALRRLVSLMQANVD